MAGMRTRWLFYYFILLLIFLEGGREQIPYLFSVLMMKKFLYRFFLFSLLPLLTLLVLEMSIGTKQEKLLSEKKLEQVFRNRADEYQWVSNTNIQKRFSYWEVPVLNTD